MNKVEEIINKIKKISEPTILYRDMKKRNGKFVIHKGSYAPTILFIGEAGGLEEDKAGKPFVGRSGKLLDKWIEQIPETEIAVINAVPIMPELNGKIRKPSNEEIDYFRETTFDLTNALNPKYIILLGRSANDMFTEKRLANCTWDEPIKTSKQEIKIGFIYHPSYYLRNGQDGVKQFEKLIEQVRPWKQKQ